SGDEVFLGSLAENQTVIGKDFSHLRELTRDNQTQQQRLNRLEPLIQQKLLFAERNIKARKEQGFEAARQLVVSDQGRLLMKNILDLTTEIKAEETQLMSARQTEAKRDSAITQWTLLFGGAISAFLTGMIAFFITRNITVPLGRLAQAAERIVAGELGFSFSIQDRSDEIGDLNLAFSRMLTSLHETANLAQRIAAGDLTTTVTAQSASDLMGTSLATMVTHLRTSTGHIRQEVLTLAGACTQIMSAVSQLSSSTAETAASVSQTATTVEEVKHTARISSEKARQVAEQSQRSVQVSSSGLSSVSESMAEMQHIRQQVEKIADSIEKLSDQTQTVSEIIATVNDISEQSNILAINASIEAARAGEHGRGFAVVAQEVRNLVDQSKQATARIKTILNDVQRATASAVQAAERGSTAVEQGLKQVTESGGAIQSLTQIISDSAQASTQILISAQEQLTGVDQVTIAMANIKQASIQNAQSMNEIKTAAQNLNEMGNRLKELVSQYRV
ncbi:MAG TPA: methyl-accepting chemotaxis protein, partial [Acidobacteriota bacterium]|nr:methyl-accepting chemotaxis protein [Acidobacteriota bacterium]